MRNRRRGVGRWAGRGAAALSGAVALTLWAGAATGRQLVEAELIDAELRRVTVRLASVGPGGVSYFNAERELERLPLDEVVRVSLVPTAPPTAADDAADASRVDEPTATQGVEDSSTAEPAPPSPSLRDRIDITLIDGQRYHGCVWGLDDGLNITHAALGNATIPLEVIAAIRPSRAPRVDLADDASLAEFDAVDDRVTLVNGDALLGFVEAIAPSGVVLLPDGGEPLTVPLDRVRDIRLANPPEPEPLDEHRLLLTDGSRLYGRGLELASGRVLGASSSSDSIGRLVLDARLPGSGFREVTLDLAGVERVDLAGARLIPLSQLEAVSLEAGPVFGVVLPPVVQARGYRAHAPARLAFALPPGATRLAVDARLLADGLAPHAIDLADCTVAWAVLTADAAESVDLGSARLRHLESPSARASAEIMVALPDQTTQLVVTIDPAAHGPIADRVLLQGLGVLVRQPPQSRSAY